MEVLSERNQMQTLVERWRMQYPLDRFEKNHRFSIIGQKLEALDPETATAADVEKIVGNGSWVAMSECDECGTKSWDVVLIGYQEYMMDGANVCVDCLRKALSLLEESK